MVGSTGAITFIGSSGSDTVLAGTGIVALTANDDTLSFTAGSGTSVIQAGTGQEVYDLLAGSAGGKLAIAGFTPGLDTIHLQDYAGNAIASQQAVGPASMFTLTHGTKVVLIGASGLAADQVFS